MANLDIVKVIFSKLFDWVLMMYNHIWKWYINFWVHLRRQTITTSGTGIKQSCNQKLNFHFSAFARWNGHELKKKNKERIAPGNTSNSFRLTFWKWYFSYTKAKTWNIVYVTNKRDVKSWIWKYFSFSWKIWQERELVCFWYKVWQERELVFFLGKIWQKRELVCFFGGKYDKSMS